MNEKNIADITDILKSEGCREIFLFGSQVTGKATEFSDIDIGVKGLPANKFFLAFYKLETVLDKKVDLVDFDRQSDFFNMLNSLGEIKKIG